MRSHLFTLPLCLWLLIHWSHSYALPSVSPSEPPPTISNIHLATTDWCPYACLDKQKPGIVSEYLTEVFSQLGISLSISSHPWSRAIHMANAGQQAVGLLTAVPEEAPGLLFTRVPTMSFQMCFFTRDQDHWQYQNIHSLNRVHLGIIQGYAYGQPLDDHLKNKGGLTSKGSKKPELTLSRISGDKGINRLLKMLRKGRIDALIEDKNVVYDSIIRIPSLQGQVFREAGCLDEIPFYLAINPSLKGSQSLMDRLDKALSEPANQQRLHTIIQSYTQQPRAL